MKKEKCRYCKEEVYIGYLKGQKAYLELREIVIPGGQRIIITVGHTCSIRK